MASSGRARQAENVVTRGLGVAAFARQARPVREHAALRIQLEESPTARCFAHRVAVARFTAAGVRKLCHECAVGKDLVGDEREVRGAARFAHAHIDQLDRRAHV